MVATVRIHHDGFPGGVLINQADFDPKTHRLFEEQSAAVGAADSEVEPAVGQDSSVAADEVGAEAGNDAVDDSGATDEPDEIQPVTTSGRKRGRR